MKLREIYFRELEDGFLREKDYPFTSEEESRWDNLFDLANHLFGKVEMEGNFVTLPEGKTFKFPQYDGEGKEMEE